MNVENHHLFWPKKIYFSQRRRKKQETLCNRCHKGYHLFFLEICDTFKGTFCPYCFYSPICPSDLTYTRKEIENNPNLLTIQSKILISSFVYLKLMFRINFYESYQ